MIFLYKFPGSVQKDLSQEASSSKPIAQSFVLASKDVSGNVYLLPFEISILSTVVLFKPSILLKQDYNY